jgi:hypothetical protein
MFGVHGEKANLACDEAGHMCSHDCVFISSLYCLVCLRICLYCELSVHHLVAGASQPNTYIYKHTIGLDKS